MHNPLRGSARTATAARRIAKAVSAFVSNRRGNVAVIVAVSALPMISAIGCVIDYSMASMVKTKLIAAADAATLAAVSNNSPVVASAKANGDVSAGGTYLTNFFNAGANPIKSSFSNNLNVSLTPAPAVTMSGTTVTARLSFTASVPTYFVRIIPGFATISVAGSSTASFTMPAYVDFYLMLDVSGSMGMPSTTAEQARLQAVNPDHNNQTTGEYPGGCTFACHFTGQSCGNQGPIPASGSATNPSPGNVCQGFIISRRGTSQTVYTAGTTNTQNGNTINWNNVPVSSCPTPGTTSCIQLRLDAVGYAVNALLSTASTTQTNDGVTNEFRVGLYPFIRKLCYNDSTCSVPLTNSLTGSTITNFSAQLANLLDTGPGQNTNLGSGGTHFENALNTMNSTVLPATAGTGTAAAPIPWVFLITDGSQDYQIYSGGTFSSENWTSNATVPNQNSATVIPPNTVTNGSSKDYCTLMKNRGVKIAILYIPYQTILNPTNVWGKEDVYANANIPNIAPALQTCASPNFFYTANTPADIQAALLAMFAQAVNTAHLTQ